MEKNDSRNRLLVEMKQVTKAYMPRKKFLHSPPGNYWR